MPRPIWTGAISFGLVNVPVKLVTAVSQKDVRFHQLHGKDHSRIQQRRWNPTLEEEVPFEELVKGYEIAPNRYVIIEPGELESLDPKASRTIDIEEFVDLDQIDPVYFDKPYYLLPDKGAEKAYALLVDAMTRTNKVALARFVMRTKQYLAAVRATEGALVLSTMNYADEVVSLSDLNGLPRELPEVTDRELAMATQLVESLSADFEPSKYTDTYREKVMALIEAKAEGEVVVHGPADEEPAKVLDLMAALEASLKAAKAARGGGAAERAEPETQAG